MNRGWRMALLSGWLLLSAATAFEGGSQATVAQVGQGRVGLGEVLETWLPVRDVLAARLRAGTATPDEVERHLQREWDKAVENAVREELFFQEAGRELDLLIRRQAQAAADQGGSSTTAGVIERELKERMDKAIDRHFRELMREQYEASGGAAALERALRERGLGPDDWRQRLWRKARTSLFFQLALSPRLPKVRPEDVRAYYQSHPEEFIRAGVPRFRHVLVSSRVWGGADAARERAVAVWQGITEGDFTFAEAAARYSDDEASRERGGLENTDTVTPARGGWLSEVAAVAAQQRPGVLGDLFDSPLGYHLVWLETPAREVALSFREAQAGINAKLQAGHFERETDRIYRRLREDVPVRVLLPRPPAAYALAAQ